MRSFTVFAYPELSVSKLSGDHSLLDNWDWDISKTCCVYNKLCIGECIEFVGCWAGWRVEMQRRCLDSLGLLTQRYSIQFHFSHNSWSLDSFQSNRSRNSLMRCVWQCVLIGPWGTTDRVVTCLLCIHMRSGIYWKMESGFLKLNLQKWCREMAD